MIKKINTLTEKFKSLSYKNKLLITCICVSILPLTITGLFNYFQISKNLISNEKNSLNYTLQTSCDSLESQIVLYENLIQHLSLSNDIISTINKDYDSIYDKYEQFTYVFDVFLNGIYAQYKDIKQITVYTVKENLEHGNQLRNISQLSKESWFTEDIHNINFITKWFVDKNNDIILLSKIPESFTKYVKKYSENYVAIKIDGKSFLYFLENLKEDYLINLTYNGNTFYSYADKDLNLHTKMFELNNNVKQNWSITIKIPYSIIIKSANDMLLVMLYIIILCLILIYILSNTFAKFLVKRINKLNSAMNSLKKGNFDIGLHDKYNDEIGILTNNFENMSKKINTLIEENYKNQLTLKETQFKALQAQINPHFLYNCLSLINSRAILNHQDDIGKMSQLMSTFYRTTLNKGKSDILLADEIKNVRSYLEIQQLLHDKSFEIFFQVDPLLPEIYVPNLILQPLVENSIVHGILPRSTKDGKIYLIVKAVDKYIHFMVMDNGIGIPSDKISSLTSTDSNGYGLKNVNERLILTYGENSALKINSIPNESTMITFEIPIKE